jgi:hypothetical protein
MIKAPELRATNIFVKDQGHLSILLARSVTASIVEQLLAAEGGAGLARLAPFVAADAPEAEPPPSSAASGL